MSWQELNRKQMDPVEAAGRGAQEAQMVVLRRPSLDWRAPLAPALVEAEVDLTPYVNTSAFKVRRLGARARAPARRLGPRSLGWRSTRPGTRGPFTANAHAPAPAPAP